MKKLTAVVWTINNSLPADRKNYGIGI